jgi:hypothetical protein
MTSVPIPVIMSPKSKDKPSKYVVKLIPRDGIHVKVEVITFPVEIVGI